MSITLEHSFNSNLLRLRAGRALTEVLAVFRRGFPGELKYWRYD